LLPTRRCACTGSPTRRCASAFQDASARRVEVRLIRSGNHAALTIADEVHGFDAVRTGRNSGGLGVVSIAERVSWPEDVTIVAELNKAAGVQVWIAVNRLAGTRIGGSQHRAAA